MLASLALALLPIYHIIYWVNRFYKHVFVEIKRYKNRNEKIFSKNLLTQWVNGDIIATSNQGGAKI